MARWGRGAAVVLLVAATSGGCADDDGGKDDVVETDRPDSDAPESDVPADTDDTDTDVASDSDGADTDPTGGDSDPVDTEVATDSDDSDAGTVDTDTDLPPVDLDGDGWTADLDCDDADETISPDAPEVCDGVDGDCDGAADDGGDALCAPSGLACVTTRCQGASGCVEQVADDACVIEGVCFAAGDPNPANPCEACDPAAAPTAWSARVAEPCDDGEPCTTGETCDATGQCAGGGPTDCSAFGDPPCSEGACVPGAGCTTAFLDGATCEDGVPCTVDDTCASGQCVSGGPPDCSSVADDCNVGACDPATGACEAVAAHLGSTCDDEDPCTASTTCATGAGGEGVCVDGVPQGDAFEANDTPATARVLAAIDDCGNTSIGLQATVNPDDDVDWFRFTLNNTSSFCDYGTRVDLDVPFGRDYDLLVCVTQSGSFSATCSTGVAVAPPSGLAGVQCCASTLGTSFSEIVDVDWGCTGTFCTDTTGTVYVRVTPAGGTQVPECATGYALDAVDD